MTTCICDISEVLFHVNCIILFTYCVYSENFFFRILDPNADPLSELEKWKRRQRLLTKVAEQLKGKECKVVLAVLINAKSKQLKKWKVIDAR